MNFFKKIPKSLIIVLIGAIIFIPYLGEAHLFDWDEINFAEASREMLLTENYRDVQINFKVFTEKPPMFFWMQALSMNYFGVNEFAARLPNALIGIITLLVLFNIGKRLKDERFGVIWVIVYISSFLPHVYFKTGLIDPLFNLFIFLSIYFVTLLTENDEFYYIKNKRLRRVKLLAFAAFFTGLAVLTKGPVGLLLHLLTYGLYIVLNRFKKINSMGDIVWFSLIFFLTTFSWYGIGFYENGPGFIDEFLQRNLDLLRTEDAEHGGFFGYHFIVLLVGCFPASILMFGGIKKHKFSTDLLQNFQKWMIAMLVVVLFIFTIVQTKIVHYSSLGYFPITFFAAYFVYYYLKGKSKWKWYHNTLLLFIGITIGVAITLIPLIGFNPEIIAGFVKDEFVSANLQAKVFWSNWESLYGLLFILALIVSANLFYTKNKKMGLAVLFLSTTIVIESVYIFFVPRIEQYTQGAPIEFFKEKRNEDCYIEVLGYKSYAYIYYNEKEIEDCIYSKYELMKMKVGKPVYYVSKNNQKDYFMGMYSQLEVIYEKNGFVFYKKK